MDQVARPAHPDDRRRGRQHGQGRRVPLLDRGPKGVSPTPYGAALLTRSAAVYDSLRQGMRDIAFLSDPGAGEVVVGASESHIAGGFLADIILDLARRHPRLTVRVVEANTAAHAFRELRSHEVDLMLGRLDGRAMADDLHADHLFDEALVAVTGGQHDWARRDGLSLADLADRPWILSPPPNAIHSLVVAAFRDLGLPPPPLGVATWSMMLRLQLLTQGPYVTAFPSSLFDYNASRWNLKVLPVTLGRKLPVAIVTLKHRLQTAAVRTFIERAKAMTAPKG